MLFRSQRRLRRDIFVKGTIVTDSSLSADWLDARFARALPPSEIPKVIEGGAGSQRLDDEVSRGLLEAMSSGPATLQAMQASLGSPRSNVVADALIRWLGSGAIEPCLEETGEAARVPGAHRLNRAILERARTSGETGHLASPVTGNGIAVSRHDRLFLLAHLEGQANPVQFAADALARQGAQVARDGRALTRDAEVIEELRSRHARFEIGRAHV